MRRRVRSLEVVSDLQRLSELGIDTTGAAGEQAFMLEMYRANALAGQFDHLSAFVDPARLAVDVGANAGQYALKLAALCRAVMVVEPHPALGWLAEALPANCVFYAGAAGAAAGRATLSTPVYDGRPQTGQATLTDVYQGGDLQQATVAVRPLDALLAEYAPDEAVGFIKIDAEGWQTAVLQGAAATLRRWRPNLQVEIWPDQLAETTELLAHFGYRGLFSFDGRLFDIARFEPDVHIAPEHAWRRDDPDAFDPTLFVGDFFFIPL